MRVYINLDNRAFVVSPTLLQEVSTLYFTRRDNVPVEVQFVRNGSVVELPAGAIGKMGLKSTFAGGFLAYAPAWTKTGSGASTIYTFSLSLGGANLDALFPADTESSVTCKVEIEWQESGNTSSTLPTAAVVYNDVIRGSETVITSPVTTLSSFKLASANYTWTITIDDDGTFSALKN
jgi:hypothetical protein